jgi:hypothetical protein
MEKCERAKSELPASSSTARILVFINFFFLLEWEGANAMPLRNTASFERLSSCGRQFLLAGFHRLRFFTAYRPV